MRSPTKSPAVRLRELRERAGLTAKQCAEQAGMAAPTSWYVFEQAQRQGDRKIPARVVQPMLSLMVGRGSPPITVDELMSLTDAATLTEAAQTTPTNPHSNAKVVQKLAGVFANQASTAQLLKVKYRAEKSVYLPRSMIEERNFGVGPIAEANDLREAQSCCIVADGDGGHQYPVGTILHLVDAREYVPHQLVGRRVVLDVADERIGLSEVRLARVAAFEGNRLTYKTMDGTDVDGSILGVVVGRYARE